MRAQSGKIVSFRRAVGLHKEDGTIPVDPLNVRILCESIEFLNRERHVADVVELSKVVVNSLGDGKDRSTAGLVLVLDVCLCFEMSWNLPWLLLWQ